MLQNLLHVFYLAILRSFLFFLCFIANRFNLVAIISPCDSTLYSRLHFLYNLPLYTNHHFKTIVCLKTSLSKNMIIIATSYKKKCISSLTDYQLRSYILYNAYRYCQSFLLKGEMWGI